MTGYIGQGLGQGQTQYFAYTCTAGQTTFTGPDNNGYVLNYNVGFADVFLNGRRLTPTLDYTATDGSSITLLSATSASDIVFISALSAFSTAQWVTNAVNYVYIATAGQTVFSGVDSNSATLSYVAGTIVVSVNGVIIPQSDYAALDGLSVTLASGVNVGDIVQIFSLRTMNPVSISNWITNNLTNIVDYTYIATAGQTTFSGSAYAGGTLAYKAGCIQVTVNGLVLTPADYTATNGTSVVLNVGCNLDDTVVIRVFGNTTVAGVYTQAQSDAKYASGNSTVISLTASGGGLANVTPAASSTNTAIGLPARSSNVMLDGPAFSAYLSVNQTVSAGTLTKVNCNIKEYDTANCYDNTTNYRFTPNVAGYYQFNAVISSTGTTTATVVDFHKNGSIYRQAVYPSNSGVGCSWTFSILIYLNGSTDYVEMYGQTNSTTTFIGNATGNFGTLFQGYLVRGA